MVDTVLLGTPKNQMVHLRPANQDEARVDLDEIVDLALKIKEAAGTVDQNEDVCEQIGRRASRIVATLSWFRSNKTTPHLRMSSALEDLQLILRRALDLLMARSTQQERKNSRCLEIFPTGKTLSRELRLLNQEMREVNQRIVERMGVANNFQTVANNNLVQDSGLARSSSPISHFMDDTSIGRSQVKAGKENVAGESQDSPLPSVGFRSFSLSSLVDITNHFSDERVIVKQSGFAKVYKGFFADGYVVVVKRYEHGTRYPVNYADIFSASLEHKNLTRFLGFHHKVQKKVVQNNGRYVVVDVHDSLVVEEFMPNGSLDHYMEGRSWLLDWPSMFGIIGGIAQGLAYLHSNCVIHLDLKPDKIFLDLDMNPKISGFEISKKLKQEHSETRTDELVGTRHYMAPEYVRSGIVSIKNDIYAFGVLLLVAISGVSKSGFQEDPVHWAWKVWKAQETRELSDPSSYNQSQQNKIERCFLIGLACIQMNRERRPTMPVVLEMLNSEEELPTIALNNEERSEDAPKIPVSFTSFRFTELKAATSNFSEENMIAKGHIATVYKGILDGLVVAIKRFHGPWGPQIVKQYCDVFKELRPHKNVVSFLGYCNEVEKEAVVEDYMPSRSLSKIMDASPQKLDLDWVARFRIIQGIADGVAHLHNEGIIHFDLTPANIVISDEHMNPKICDFGLSKILNEGDSETGTDGFEFAAGSKAPEYNEDGIISEMNDVYSFGDFLRTFCGMSRPGPPKDLNDLARVVQEARRMKDFFDPSSCDTSQLKQIKRCMDIALLCTQMEPRCRPTMMRTLWMLNGNKKVQNPKRNNSSSSKKKR